MRSAGILLVVFLIATALAQNEQPKPLKTVPVNIEASEFDRRLLLEKLNDHGKDDGLRFEQAEKSFDYRIVFKVEQGTKIRVEGGNGGTSNTSEATATVFDSKGSELFSFKRAGRRTDGGATNATAKEIIKRMLKLQAPAAASAN